MLNTNLEVGKRYTIKSTYSKPSEKHFKGVSTFQDNELRGKTLTCIRLSSSGLSAWFKFRGEEFWVKRSYLTQEMPVSIVVNPKINLNKPQCYIIRKPPHTVAKAFWVPAMNKYVGSFVRITTPETPSKWVKIDADNGGYLWDRDWLKPITWPVKENTMHQQQINYKVRKLTLQEELANIDTKYDAKIRQIKWDSKNRQGEITRKADDYKQYLNRDKTSQNVENYILASEKPVEKPESKAKTWFKKIGLWSLAGLAAIGVYAGVYWGLTTYIQ